MSDQEKEKAGKPSVSVFAEILKAIAFLALLAFLAYNAMNYADWARQKEAERPATTPPPSTGVK